MGITYRIVVEESMGVKYTQPVKSIKKINA